VAEVLVSEAVDEQPLAALRAAHDVGIAPDLWQDADRLQAEIADARALIVRNQTRVTADLLAAAPRLEVIGRCGAGLDNIDVEAAERAGVVVAYAPVHNAVSVAELTVGLMLALARRIPAADADTKAGGWHRAAFTGTELYGKTLGVLGLGRIGFLVARRANALGMRVLAHDAYANPDHPMVLESSARLVDAETLLGEADVISCHLPCTPTTRGFLNADRFARLKPGAMVLNLSRGELVDEPALIEALRSGQVGGAALDVRAAEPPECGELETMDNVILTPHIAAFTHEAQRRVVQVVCDDVAAVLAGGGATNYFNFPRPVTGGAAR